jgi:hypothetical protein
MKAFFLLWLLAVSSAHAEHYIVCDSTTRAVLGVFTVNPTPAAGQYKRTLTPEEYASVFANRTGRLVDDPSGVRAATTAELPANEQELATVAALIVKLDAGTITVAEQRQLLGAVVKRIARLERLERR